MQVKKFTAKIRDMVKVSLMENGDERAWYHNIELPDAIKELEMKDFWFNLLTSGKIEFQIIFEQGVLPKQFPEKKARNRRGAKADESKAAVPARETIPAAAAPEVKAIAKVEDKSKTPAAHPVLPPGCQAHGPGLQAGSQGRRNARSRDGFPAGQGEARSQAGSARNEGRRESARGKVIRRKPNHYPRRQFQFRSAADVAADFMASDGWAT